jgi:hypothetical protein
MDLHFPYSSKFPLPPSILGGPPFPPPNVGPTIFLFISYFSFVFSTPSVCASLFSRGATTHLAAESSDRPTADVGGPPATVAFSDPPTLVPVPGHSSARGAEA